MTYLQQKTINEMMRQGLHTQLSIAKQQWHEHRKYEPQTFIHLSRLLSDLIKKSNHEVERSIP
ncbi:MAG: hypothetical protein QM504_09945 [Pseudomonadota bacterium]